MQVLSAYKSESVISVHEGFYGHTVRKLVQK